MSKKKKGRKGSGGSDGLPLFPIVVGAIVVIGVIAVLIVASGDNGGGDSGPLEVAPVTVTGDPLAPYPGLDAPDPAVGAVAPTLAGEDFAGNPVEIAPGPTKKAVVFLAHWCPHCQAEVPRLSDYLSTAGLPDGVEVYLVPTGTSRVRPNYPPSDWLQREGLGDRPTLVDSEGADAANAYGLTSYPYWVLLDDDNTVLGRLSGELPEGAFDSIFTALAAGQPITAGTAGPASQAG